MSKWQEKTKRPVLPVYMAALVWPVMALLVPIYTLGGLVLTAAVSAGAYFAGTKLCPTRVVRTYVPYATGSEDVDAMLNGIAANLDALHKLNEAIPDPQLSRAMDRMEKAGRSIAAVVEKTPDKARSVDRFARYYLPGTSRSGSTIIGGLLCGMSRACASQFTFFLAIPVMAGASGLKLVKFLAGGGVFTVGEIGALLVGCIVAFVVSILAIRFLMDYVKKHTFTAFGWYRIALGIVVLGVWALQTFVLA